MSRRLVTILVLLAITTQAALGGFRDGAVLCLGGGHEHEATEVDPAACELACSHESEWPVPVPTQGHDDCGCSDVDLSLVDLPSTSRNTVALDVALLAAAPLALLLAEAGATGLRPPPRLDRERDDASGRRHLAVVRTTRLRL